MLGAGRTPDLLFADLAVHPELLWAFGILFAALLAGVIAIALVSRWRKQRPTTRLSLEEELSRFRHLYQQGELSSQEFERIVALLRQSSPGDGKEK